MIPSIMSPTAVSVTEAPAVDTRGSAAGLGRGGRRPGDGRAGGGTAADEATVPPGELPKEQAETTSATAGPRIAKSLLRRMRPNLVADGPTCGDVEPDGGSAGRARADARAASMT